jgi:hypothetical protein
MPRKYIKVFENSSRLRSSTECNEVLRQLGKYVDDLASKVHPKDLLAFEALIQGTVGVAFSIRRVKAYLDSKKST